VLVIESTGTTEIESPRVNAVDTTGAGDAFAGALAAELARGAELVDAARYAVKVAAISVTRRGAQPSYPTADELAR
jgi:ribokinase